MGQVKIKRNSPRHRLNSLQIERSMNRNIRPGTGILVFGAAIIVLCISTLLTASCSECFHGFAIENFTATPNPVASGETTTLRWRLDNPEGVIISCDVFKILPGGGKEVVEDNNLGDEGSVSLTIDEDTSFLLDCDSACDEDRSELEVTIE
ncbi:MAG: hypothetical protein AB1405_15305 [Bdellovibrionota bacterium]